MNKFKVLILTLCFFQAVLTVSGQNPVFRLHLNKHYFMPNEKIEFTFRSSSPSILPDGLPIHVVLFRIMEDYQHLINTVELPWNGYQVDGHMSLSAALPTGQYLIGIFSQHGLERNVPFHFAYIYIYNPSYPDSGATPFDLESNHADQYNAHSFSNIQGESKHNYLSSYVLQGDSSSRTKRFVGKIQPVADPASSYHLSVSVVDKRFYDKTQESYLIDQHQEILNSYLEEWRNLSNKDSIINEGNYLLGRLLTNGAPVILEKVYIYCRKDSIMLLDFYITDNAGRFKFKKPSIGDTYTIKLFTSQETDRKYSFHMQNTIYNDSIYFLDIPDYWLIHSAEFRAYAQKKQLIDSSYPVTHENTEPDQADHFKWSIEPSHTIILDDYINFSTLAEIIREIVPYVSINYRKGKYQIRINDARVKEFCCKGNPLMFINDDLYTKLQMIMDIPTSDIYSLEVFRPVEAIHLFGDIGLNGMLKINLKENRVVEIPAGNNEADFIVKGFQMQTTELVPEFPSEDYPDFRNLVFWDADIRPEISGKFEFLFQPSRLNSDFGIVIYGMSPDRELFRQYIDFVSQK